MDRESVLNTSLVLFFNQDLRPLISLLGFSIKRVAASIGYAETIYKSDVDLKWQRKL